MCDNGTYGDDKSGKCEKCNPKCTSCDGEADYCLTCTSKLFYMPE